MFLEYNNKQTGGTQHKNRRLSAGGVEVKRLQKRKVWIFGLCNRLPL